MKDFLQQSEKHHDNTRIQQHTTGRLEHPNQKEVEEIDFKHKIMKVFETIKQDVKNSLKEMEEKTKKRLEEMNKFLKDTQENQEKNNQTGKGNS